MKPEKGWFSAFLKHERARTGLSQEELARKSGLGLRFIRDVEQGKKSLRLDKLNQVLALFGMEAGPVPIIAKEEADA
jgi:y4mF family transcriptional regulator